MKVKSNLRSGFTLVELLVVIAIIASLAALSTPAVTKTLKRAALTTSISNARQIKLALDNFAVDFDGEYVNDSNGTIILTGFSGADAASCFDVLIEAAALDRADESIFYTKELKNVNSGHTEGDAANALDANECGYSYVKGLANTSKGPSPLVTTQVSSATGAFYSDLWDHKAVIARVNGSVSPERISGSAGNDGQVVETVNGTAGTNIFEWSVDPDDTDSSVQLVQ